MIIHVQVSVQDTGGSVSSIGVHKGLELFSIQMHAYLPVAMGHIKLFYHSEPTLCPWIGL